MKEKKLSIKQTLLRMRKSAKSQEELHTINMWLAEIKVWEREEKSHA